MNALEPGEVTADKIRKTFREFWTIRTLQQSAKREPRRV